MWAELALKTGDYQSLLWLINTGNAQIKGRWWWWLKKENTSEYQWQYPEPPLGAGQTAQCSILWVCQSFLLLWEFFSHSVCCNSGLAPRLAPNNYSNRFCICSGIICTINWVSGDSVVRVNQRKDRFSQHMLGQQRLWNKNLFDVWYINE